jgi:hypothetical protein
VVCLKRRDVLLISGEHKQSPFLLLAPPHQLARREARAGPAPGDDCSRSPGRLSEERAARIGMPPLYHAPPGP